MKFNEFDQTFPKCNTFDKSLSKFSVISQLEQQPSSIREKHNKENTQMEEMNDELMMEFHLEQLLA